MIGLMFKKQVDFVRKHLDSIEEFLGPDSSNNQLEFDDRNGIYYEGDASDVTLIIDGKTFVVAYDEIDNFIVVENTLANLTDEQLRMVTAKGMDNGLEMGNLKFNTTMEPPSLVVTNGKQTATFLCDGIMILDEAANVPTTGNLTFEEAVAKLPDAEIYKCVFDVGALLMADWSREELLKAMKNSKEIQLAGPTATDMGFEIAFIDPITNDWLFVQTKRR